MFTIFTLVLSAGADQSGLLRMGCLNENIMTRASLRNLTQTSRNVKESLCELKSRGLMTCGSKTLNSSFKCAFIGWSLQQNLTQKSSDFRLQLNGFWRVEPGLRGAQWL